MVGVTNGPGGMGLGPSHHSFETCVRNQTIVNLAASFRCYQHPTCIVSNKSLVTEGHKCSLNLEDKDSGCHPIYEKKTEDPDLQKKIQA